MTGWRRWLRLVSLLVLVVILYFVVPVSLDERVNFAAQLAITLVVLVLLSLGVVWQVRLQITHSDRHIDGLIIALMISVMAFALGFYVMAERTTNQLVGIDTRLDALYFTMTTLLTIGFGDIHASGQVARTLVLVQMVFNVVVIATAASTLTTRIRTQAELRAEERRANPPDPSERRRRLQRRRTHRNPT